jgi:hypothetical protein
MIDKLLHSRAAQGLEGGDIRAENYRGSIQKIRMHLKCQMESYANFIHKNSEGLYGRVHIEDVVEIVGADKDDHRPRL